MTTFSKLLPMLAKPYSPKYLVPPVLAQAKLDGVRLVWDGARAWSRTGKPIEGVPGIVAELEQHFKGFALDGELYDHDMHFQEIVGAVRRTAKGAVAATVLAPPSSVVSTPAAMVLL